MKSVSIRVHPWLKLLLCVICALPAHAELAIYNVTARQTVVGLGVETTLFHTGVLLWDIDTGNAWQVQTFRVNGARLFTVSDRSDDTFLQAQGRPGRVFTGVVSITNNAVDRQAVTFTFGRNTTFALRPGRTVFLPRTGRFTGYAVALYPSGDVFGPITGAYSFSPSRTLAAHTAGQTLAAALAATRAAYQAKGYTEVQP